MEFPVLIPDLVPSLGTAGQSLAPLWPWHPKPSQDSSRALGCSSSSLPQWRFDSRHRVLLNFHWGRSTTAVKPGQAQAHPCSSEELRHSLGWQPALFCCLHTALHGAGAARLSIGLGFAVCCRLIKLPLVPCCSCPAAPGQHWDSRTDPSWGSHWRKRKISSSARGEMAREAGQDWCDTQLSHHSKYYRYSLRTWPGEFSYQPPRGNFLPSELRHTFSFPCHSLAQKCDSGDQKFLFSLILNKSSSANASLPLVNTHWELAQLHQRNGNISTSTLNPPISLD